MKDGGEKKKFPQLKACTSIAPSYIKNSCFKTENHLKLEIIRLLIHFYTMPV